MGPPTNLELNAKREEHCIQVTPERKYVSGAFDPRRSNRSQPAHWSKRSDVYQSKKKKEKIKKTDLILF